MGTVLRAKKSVDLVSDQTCKNEGVCIFKHCFCADYFVGGISVLANITEIDSTIRYEKNGSFSVEIPTAAFVPGSANVDSSVAITVSARLGECGMDP